MTKENIFQEMKCKNCGAPLTQISLSKLWKCNSCGTTYYLNIDDQGDSFLSEKINVETIKTNKINKKATSIPISEIKVQELKLKPNYKKIYSSTKSDLSEEETLAAAKNYIRAHQWKYAVDSIDKSLNKNSYGELFIKKFLAKNHIESLSNLNKNLLKNTDINLLSSAFQQMNVDDVKKYLQELQLAKINNDDDLLKILNIVGPYIVNKKIITNKKNYTNSYFKTSISNGYEDSFKYLLNLLDKDEVDNYIELNLKMANSPSIGYPEKYFDNVLKVDKSNSKALKGKIELLLVKAKEPNLIFDYIKQLLSYSSSPNSEISYLLNLILKLENINLNHSLLFKKIIGCNSNGPKHLLSYIIDFAYKLLNNGLFNEAEKYFFIALSIDNKNSRIYWGLCLSSIKAKNDSEVTMDKPLIQDTPYFNKFAAYNNDNLEFREKLKLANSQPKTPNYFKAHFNQNFENNETQIKTKNPFFKPIKIKPKHILLTLFLLLIVAFFVSFVFTTYNPAQKNPSSISNICFIVVSVLLSLYVLIAIVIYLKNNEKARSVFLIGLVIAIPLGGIVAGIVPVVRGCHQREEEESHRLLSNIKMNALSKENTGPDTFDIYIRVGNKGNYQIHEIVGDFRLTLPTKSYVLEQETVRISFNSDPVIDGSEKIESASFDLSYMFYEQAKHDTFMKATFKELKIEYKFTYVSYEKDTRSYKSDYFILKEAGF